jgi:hypothetical protein
MQLCPYRGTNSEVNMTLCYADPRSVPARGPKCSRSWSRAVALDFPPGAGAARTGLCLCLAAVAWLGCASTASGAAIRSFQLGSTARPGSFYSPASLHSSQGPNLIRVKFDTDVRVGFYDLELRVVGTNAYSLPLSGFSYDPGSYAALWRIDGMGFSTSERFQAVLSNVTGLDGAPLTGGPYTNTYTILTGDVSGDDTISPLDVLVVINAINAGAPYNPNLDVNFDEVVGPSDVLIIINEINAPDLPAIPEGSFHPVPMVPPAGPRFTCISCGKEVVLTLSDMPPQASVSIEQSNVMPATNWQSVYTFFASSTSTNLLLPRDRDKAASFYRASFR